MGGEMKLTPDEIECLISICRRSPLQDKLVSIAGKQLVEKGAITIDNEWPYLTVRGQKSLDKIRLRLLDAALSAGQQHPFNKKVSAPNEKTRADQS